MSDSNNQQQPTTAKSFTQRFFELEEHAEKTTEIFLSLMQTMQEMRLEMDRLRNEVDGLMDSTSATIQLLHDGKKVTKDAIVDKILEDRATAIEMNVETAVKENKIVKVESVSGNESMISYKIKDKVRFAYNKVGFLEEALRNSMVGKKAGDVVDGVEILGVYEIAPQSEPSQGN